MRTTDKIGLAAAAAAVAAAVVTEARKPASERTGFGMVAGVLPYDFRRPTLDRIRRAIWAPDDPRVIKPHAFGVGWTVNVGRLAHIVRSSTRPGG